MALRFRRSIRIAPGVTLNLGKKGVSVSAGPKGASVTLGKNGLWGNIGLPGTGLSYRTRLGGNPAQRARQAAARAREEQRQQLLLGGLASLQISLDEKGQLLLADNTGRALTPSEKRQVWQQLGAELARWLAVAMEDINGDMALILTIHHYIQAPASQVPSYHIAHFNELAPLPPTVQNKAAAPARPELKLRFWDYCWPGRVAKLQLAQHVVEQGWQQAVTDWQGRCAEQEALAAKHLLQYQSDHQAWLATKSAYAAEQAQIAAAFSARLNNDTELVAELLEQALVALDWPRETLVSFELQLNQGRVFLDVDLPEIEDLPKQSASLGADQKRLLIKAKSARQLREEYACHVHAIVLRLVGLVFALLPEMKEVVVSGYSQRLNAATGHIDDDYLLSVLFTQAQYSGLNFKQLDRLDPILVLEQAQLVRKMTTTGMFSPITPLAPSP